jgi:hypothetical protein
MTTWLDLGEPCLQKKLSTHPCVCLAPLHAAACSCAQIHCPCRPGRKMTHKLAEGEIYAALENVCSKVCGKLDAKESSVGQDTTARCPKYQAQQLLPGIISMLCSLKLEYSHGTAEDDPHALPGPVLPTLRTGFELFLLVQYAAGRTDAAQACGKFIDPIKDAAEEFIFQHGVDHQLRRHLCVELTKTCSVHQLYDSGEL